MRIEDVRGVYTAPPVDFPNTFTTGAAKTGFGQDAEDVDMRDE